MSKDFSYLKEIAEGNNSGINAILEIVSRDILSILNEYEQLKEIEKEHKKENGKLRKRIKELENEVKK